MSEADLLRRRLDRERRARAEAERLLEEKSLELYEAKTEVEKSLERVQRREALIKSVLDNVLDGVITFDANGTIRVFSGAASRIFGLHPDEVVGGPIGTLIPEFDLADKASPFAAVVNGNEFNELALGGYETTAIRKDGEEFAAEAAVTQFNLMGVQTIVVTVRDVSRQKHDSAVRHELESQLRHLQKMESLGTLAGGVAHEFNNMLVPIITLTELTQEELDEGSLEHENLGHVLGAAARARSLIAKVLTFSRKNDPSIEEVRLSDVVQTSASLLENTIPSTTRLDIEVPRPEMIIHGDRTELEQIILNLVGNGSAALNGEEGWVKLSFETHFVRNRSRENRMGLPEGEFILLTVEDNGSGMDDETADRIFDPFFTTKSVGQGTGLGLAIVHSIVERSQGLIDLRTAPGEGTTFRIFLPAPSEQENRAQDDDMQASEAA